MENINFIGCYRTWLKDSINALTNIRIEFLMHIKIFIPLKTSFFFKGNSEIRYNYQNDNLENLKV